MTCEDLQNIRELRKNIFLAAYSSGGGHAHLASSFSIVEILYVLYMKGILKYRSGEPLWKDRDILVISKGHASLAAYAVLAMAGFFDREELFTFCCGKTRLGGEPSMLLVPGVESSSAGSLGHGLSFGAGAALANKMDKSGSKVYVIIGDGECEEGTIWEAAMSAARHRLDNLTVILDNNRIQKMGFVMDTMSIDSWESRWRAFGWHIIRAGGHDTDSLAGAFGDPGEEGKPRLVIADTVKGKGVSIMENNPDWHFKMPNKKELKTVIQELGITGEELLNCRKHTSWH
ncbi:MAG: transketolase [Treponema sp.]|jgi:transketolase|nr:transketolase [Treponema sp.]